MSSASLQHENGEQYGSKHGKVTVYYDGRHRDLAVDQLGKVYASNQKEVEKLTEEHGGFQLAEDEDTDELPEYVLGDLNVSEVKEYVRDVNSEDRLLELRELESEHEDRTTAKNHIDNRLSKIRSRQRGGEDGEETGDE
jgi:hypothetical protein